MAYMIDKKPENNSGEKYFWEQCNQLLPDEDVVVYNNHEVNGTEFDFCLFIKNKGIAIVEVKAWEPDDITVNSKDDIYVKSFNKSFKSPKSQANVYRYALKNKIESKYHFTPLVLSMVCYTKVSKRQYYELRLDIASEIEYTLVKEDLENENSLYGKICAVFDKDAYYPHDSFTENRMLKVREMWESKVSSTNRVENKHYSTLTIFNESVSKDDLDALEKEYNSGVKQIVFVRKEEDERAICTMLNDTLKLRNINAKKGNLELGFKDEVHIPINIFGFQVFLYKCDLSINNNIQIIDGRFKEYTSILEELSKHTLFNYEQYLVEHAPVDKHITVKAGAGTGKTYSMVSRVAFLCNCANSKIHNISTDLAMVTFTNDAADNMKKRLKQMFKNYFVLTRDPIYLEHVENIDRSSISTIHKFCIEALRNASYYTGLGTNFSITTNEDLRKKIYDKHISAFLDEMQENNEDFIKDIPVPTYDLKKKTMEMVDKLIAKSIDINSIQISSFGTLVAKNIPYFNELLKDTIFKAEEEYLSTLEANNFMDLKECIIVLNKLFAHNDKLLEKLNIKYLFIDEFQDTDDVQIELFKSIRKSIDKVNSSCYLFMVGDLKQSIYRFRGAKLSAFDEIEKMDSNNWNEYTLNMNYRTDLNLLSLYDKKFKKFGEDKYLPYDIDDRLIGVKSFDYTDKYLECVKCHGNDIDVFYDTVFETLKKQCLNLKQYAELNKSLIKEERTIALLVRNNWQVAAIVNEGNKRDFNIEVHSGGELYQLDSTHDLYKLVLAILNYKNPVHLVNFMESNYVDLNLDYLQLYGIDENEKLDILTDALNKFFKTRMNKSWNDIIEMALTEPVLYVLRKIYEALQPWQKYNNSYSSQRFYMENYEYLLEKITKFFKIDTLTINEVADYLRINILTKRKELSRKIDEEDDGIHIVCTTVHKAKGLEYGTVIIPFTDDEMQDLKRLKTDANYSKSKLSYYVKFDNDVIEYNSNYNSDQEMKDQEQEETRILYVALTRAIFNCIWILNVDSKPKLSWGLLMEDDYVD